MPHTRPTTDIAKEGLFNILQHQIAIDGAATLDLFGGTGCISYELASRGAALLTVVEKDPQMHQFITATAKNLGIQNVSVIQSDVFRFLDRSTQKFDFIFAGPPYALTTIDELPKIIAEKRLLLPGGLFILEHTPRNSYEAMPEFKWVRSYGTTLFSAFTPPAI